jgi:hypothetical protein
MFHAVGYQFFQWEDMIVIPHVTKTLSLSHFPPSTRHRPSPPFTLPPPSRFGSRSHRAPLLPLPRARPPLPTKALWTASSPPASRFGRSLDFGPPPPQSTSWVGSRAHWVPSLIRATPTLAFIPQSCMVSIKPPATARRASPSTNAARPPSFPPPQRHPTLTMIPALLLLPGRSVLYPKTASI